MPKSRKNNFLYFITMALAIFKAPHDILLLQTSQGCFTYCGWLKAKKSQSIISSYHLHLPNESDGIFKPTFGNDIINLAKDCFVIGRDCSITDKNTILLVVTRLKNYFEGQEISLSGIPYHLEGTPFQKKVWQEIARIPFSSLMTYARLASEAGMPHGYRAVAGACGANPLSIFIPCHRVVGSNSKIGGYAGGIEIKHYLLAHEQKFSSAFNQI